MTGAVQPGIMYSNRYDCITGRWCGRKYILLKKLGSGGIGEIYLVERDDGERLALKIGRDLISITKEYNYLKKFEGKIFLPEAYELDDLEKGDESYHFFTMEYIEGYTLKNALKSGSLPLKAKCRIICLIIRLLKQINDAGYAYTDLKYENIMLDRKNGLVRLIDLGSLVEIGQTVKEYTPMYDRMSWGAGSRTADAAYQVFAIAVLFASMLLGRGLDPDSEGLERVLQVLKKQKLPGRIHEIIMLSLYGKIESCDKLFYEIASITDTGVKNAGLTGILNVIIIILTVLLTITVFAWAHR